MNKPQKPPAPLEEPPDEKEPYELPPPPSKPDPLEPPSPRQDPPPESPGEIQPGARRCPEQKLPEQY